MPGERALLINSEPHTAALRGIEYVTRARRRLSNMQRAVSSLSRSECELVAANLISRSNDERRTSVITLLYLRYVQSRRSSLSQLAFATRLQNN